MQVFVELAATALGETERAAKLNRERVLDAFLPIFLGAPPALARVANVRGRGEMRRNVRQRPRDRRSKRSRSGAGRAAESAEALAWAAVRFLLADAELTPLIPLGFAEAAGEEGSGERWEAAQPQLAASEGAFEAFLRDAVLEELLAAYATAPTPVDRWESSSALRLIANIDLDPDASDAQRPLLARGAREILKEHPVPTRFLSKYERELDLVLQSRSRLQAQKRLHKIARKELARRSAGYGHPAVEAASRTLSKALDRALRARSEVEQ